MENVAVSKFNFVGCLLPNLVQITNYNGFIWKILFLGRAHISQFDGDHACFVIRSAHLRGIFKISNCREMVYYGLRNDEIATDLDAWICEVP